MKYVYLVYCNVNPIVYCVYGSYKKAIKHFYGLIDYRKQLAQDQEGKNLEYYHFHIYPNKSLTDKNGKLQHIDLTLASACIKYDKNSKLELDGCHIYVVKKPLN